MPPERVRDLDPDILKLFSLKGTQGWYPAGNMNSVKVRRVMQIIRDFAKAPFEKLLIYDFGCAEGVYAIEAGLRGAHVVGFDGRNARMDDGIKIAKRLGLEKLKFEQADIRNITVKSHGKADVILFLGILYHLDDRDAFAVLQNMYELCDQFVIIDTHIALQGLDQSQNKGKTYDGLKMREHADDDPKEVRESRVGASLDNPLSFWFTRQSLYRLLNDVGFTSVCECHIPLEPLKPANRITIIAAKGEAVKLSSYPWLNEKTEEEIAMLISSVNEIPVEQLLVSNQFSAKQLTKSLINNILRRFGVEIRRID